ncbi:nickel pincer cofactor biosynthesis protein LarB [Azospirillum canadense]|uniref:nickel pincer cofactor biosynthesis protein LarB n=1 Tax=Azospirillum canadense TaxID=403962 RepID=UPI002225C5D6|nr:nickel pincer cofactor biosynthesis protein LarB [Azospirillum canadense]MCW2241443.1 NCAIR mutase (PurE)-related protein [Azospirillum canadense]
MSGEERSFRLDWARQARTGFPEAVFCAGKSIPHIAAILAEAAERNRPLLLTRLSPAQHDALPAEARRSLDYDAPSGTAIAGPAPAPAALRPGIGIVAAGTSDWAVAREAARSLAFCGYAAPIVADVGVAGLWRLMERMEEIARFRVVIAVAGMEGALFSVLAGLVTAPVIAVPTSVGYGVASGGIVALHAALGGCAPGVVTVNIDNGFGAAAAAVKMLRSGAEPPP